MKMDLREIEWDWIHVPENRDQWRAVASTVIKPSDSMKGRGDTRLNVHLVFSENCVPCRQLRQRETFQTKFVGTFMIHLQTKALKIIIRANYRC